MYDARIILAKKGRAKYVSHLDMFRVMQRAVRRAKIPLWYTEGFNPHPYISFLLAMPLGLESDGEPVDIRIIDNTPFDEIKARLNAALPEGFEVISCAMPVAKPAEIASADYTVIYDGGDISEGELKAALASGALTCQKSAKQGGRKIMKEIDVSSCIIKSEVGTVDGDTVLRVTLPAGSSFNLNPMQLTAAVGAYTGRELYPAKAVREKLMTESGDIFR